MRHAVPRIIAISLPMISLISTFLFLLCPGPFATYPPPTTTPTPMPTPEVTPTLTPIAPYVKLNPITSVGIGEPLVVKGASNRQQGFSIVVTCTGPVELEPQVVSIANDTFEATFDTTGALTGEYIVKADDGDGHTDEVEVNIGEAAATPKPPEEEPTPAPPTVAPSPAPTFPSDKLIIFILALIVATIVVRVFPYGKGKFKLEFWGLKFSGNQGPITLWCLVYLSTIIGYNLLLVI
jgi:hypothetical protein